MIRTFAKLLVFWLPTRELRRTARWRLVSWWYGRRARRIGSVGPGVYFLGRSVLNKQTVIEGPATINGISVSGSGKVMIGQFCQIAADCLILTQNHDYDSGERIPFGRANTIKDVTVGPCVWIGRRVIILPGTSIGEGAIIQAGSVVHGNIPPLAIAGGNPARVFSQRDAAHYNLLKHHACFLDRPAPLLVIKTEEQKGQPND